MEKQSAESRIFPDPLHAEVKVEAQLPPEAKALLNDLHSDRQGIGIGSAIMVACTVAIALKQVFGDRK